MLEYKVKLIKIESNHKLLRTNEIIGTCIDLPIVGSRFKIYAEPLQEGAHFRHIDTSQVISVEYIYEKIIEFKTLNSTYHLELLGD